MSSGSANSTVATERPKTGAAADSAAGPDIWAGEPEFKPLTAEEARGLRKRQPLFSPWRVVAAQIMVGALLALAGWLLTGKPKVGWSTGYGALAVALPAAIFARGLTSRVASANAGSAVAGFFLWELVKIGLTVAMLFAAPQVVSPLSWPAMLVGLIVTMKVYWLVPLFGKRFQMKSDE
ncbi:MAG: ATP synthase subunit I [Burkholderiales bacterium]